MVLSLLLLVLLLAIALRQGAQGLFSALIMMVLTICCAAAALGTHEWVVNQWVAPIWPLNRDFMLPVTLAVTFAVPLVLLRLGFDRLVRRACLLPPAVDKAGGGVCGLVTGYVTVGLFALCLQMLPFGIGILGYSRFAIAQPGALRATDVEPPDPDAEGKGLILGPDRFAAGLMSVVSSGVFSGSLDFYEYNPDYSEAIGWVGATHREVSRYAPPRSIAVLRTGLVDAVYRMTPGDQRSGAPPTYDEIRARTGLEFRMVRVQLKRDARDAQKSHTFSIRQFRLVGRLRGGEVDQFAPSAILQVDAEDVINRHVRVKRLSGKFWPVTSEVLAPRDNDGQVEMVFELPTGFKPSFIEYKRQARATVVFEQAASAAPGRRPRDTSASTPGATSETGRGTPAAPTSPTVATATPEQSAEVAPTPPPAPRRDSGRRRRRVRSVAPSEGGQSRFSDEMPMVLRSYQRLKNAEIINGALKSGHLVGEVDSQANGTDEEVRKFAVPDGKRLLQLSSQRLKVRSGLGRAISLAITTVQNYYVTDERGRRFSIIGKYAIAAARGSRHIEIQYFSEPSGSMGGLGAFDRINEANLSSGDDFYLLFLVDPGARIVSFSSGSSVSAADDLSMANLVAPQ